VHSLVWGVNERIIYGHGPGPFAPFGPSGERAYASGFIIAR